jgi:hypothetical protein
MPLWLIDIRTVVAYRKRKSGILITRLLATSGKQGDELCFKKMIAAPKLKKNYRKSGRGVFKSKFRLSNYSNTKN